MRGPGDHPKNHKTPFPQVQAIPKEAQNRGYIWPPKGPYIPPYKPHNHKNPRPNVLKSGSEHDLSLEEILDRGSLLGSRPFWDPFLDPF